MLAKKEKISKKLTIKLDNRQKISDTFVEARKAMLADLQKSNQQLEVSSFHFNCNFILKSTIFVTQIQVMLNRPPSSSRSSRSSTDSCDNEHEKDQKQEVEPIPLVEPSNVAKNEPKRLKKMVLPNLNLSHTIFSTRKRRPSVYINPSNQNVCKFSH